MDKNIAVGIFNSITPIIQNAIWIYYLCKFGNCRDRRASPVGKVDRVIVEVDDTIRGHVPRTDEAEVIRVRRS